MVNWLNGEWWMVVLYIKRSAAFKLVLDQRMESDNNEHWLRKWASVDFADWLYDLRYGTYICPRKPYITLWILAKSVWSWKRARARARVRPELLEPFGEWLVDRLWRIRVKATPLESVCVFAILSSLVWRDCLLYVTSTPKRLDISEVRVNLEKTRTTWRSRRTWNTRQ